MLTNQVSLLTIKDQCRLYLHDFVDNLRDGEVLLLDDQVLDALHDEARPLVDERAEHVKRRGGGLLLAAARCRVAVGHRAG